MSDPRSPINPYAPPASSVYERPVSDHWVWRDGDWLVFRSDALLPPYCMVTGEPAPYEHPISQIWQPKWAYLLLLFALFPYFFLSPFIHRRLEIALPFGRTVYRKHRRWVNSGLLLMLVGALLVLFFIVTTISQWLTGPVALALIIGVLLFLVGMQLASSSPVRLNIFKIEGNIVIVEDVHPAYLALLPAVTDSIGQQSGPR